MPGLLGPAMFDISDTAGEQRPPIGPAATQFFDIDSDQSDTDTDRSAGGDWPSRPNHHETNDNDTTGTNSGDRPSPLCRRGMINPCANDPAGSDCPSLPSHRGIKPTSPANAIAIQPPDSGAPTRSTTAPLPQFASEPGRVPQTLRTRSASPLPESKRARPATAAPPPSPPTPTPAAPPAAGKAKPALRKRSAPPPEAKRPRPNTKEEATRLRAHSTVPAEAPEAADDRQSEAAERPGGLNPSSFLRGDGSSVNTEAATGFDIIRLGGRTTSGLRAASVPLIYVDSSCAVGTSSSSCTPSETEVRRAALRERVRAREARNLLGSGPSVGALEPQAKRLRESPG